MDREKPVLWRTGGILFFFCTLLLTALILSSGCTGNSTSPVMVAPTGESGFEMKMVGPHFTVYFPTGDDEDAGYILAVLEQEGMPLFTQYLGTEPAQIPVYLATGTGEYGVKSGKPGKVPAISAGDTSVNNGSIILYRPAHCMRSCEQRIPFFSRGAWYVYHPLVVRDPWPDNCLESCIIPHRVIWAGAYASIQQYLGPDTVQNLPYFLREGMAKYVENQYRSQTSRNWGGEPDFPFSAFAPGTDGQPVLMTADQMEKRCNGYTNDVRLATLCREETVYALGYISGTYGSDTMASLLPELKKTHDWRTALRNVTGKDTDDLWRDIIRSHELAIGADRIIAV